jgi:hypothetical protein
LVKGTEYRLAELALDIQKFAIASYREYLIKRSEC